MSSDWNAACRDSARVAGSRSSLFSGPEAFRQQPRFCRLKFPGLMKKTKKTRSGGTGCGTQWVSGSRRGNQLNAAAGRRTAVATGRCSTLRVEPRYPRYAGWKTVIAGCRKNRAARRQKTVAKQLITSLKNRPFYHLLHRKEGQLPDEKCDALPLRAEKLSLPQSGDSDWRWRNGQPGHPAGYPVCSVAEKNPELERELASQSEELVDLQAHPFLTCGINTAARSCSGDGDGFSVLYLLDVGVMNVPVP